MVWKCTQILTRNYKKSTENVPEQETIRREPGILQRSTEKFLDTIRESSEKSNRKVAGEYIKTNGKVQVEVHESPQK